METLLRAAPDDLPNLLTALGITEHPAISNDSDPHIGLSWNLPKAGIELSFDKSRVSTIFLYGPSERESCYLRPLPMGVDWDASFNAVVAKLGSASSHSPGGEDGPLGPIPPWLRYDNDDHCLHFQFTADKSQIAMVTIMTAERAP